MKKIQMKFWVQKSWAKRRFLKRKNCKIKSLKLKKMNQGSKIMGMIFYMEGAMIKMKIIKIFKEKNKNSNRDSIGIRKNKNIIMIN